MAHADVTVGDRGRLVLPASIRTALDLRPGTRMLLSIEPDGSLRLRPYRAVADQGRGVLVGRVGAGSLVDELLAERRADARREGVVGAAVPGAVLDASALLAYLDDEPGAELVSDHIAVGARIATVNLAEVLGVLATRGLNPADIAGELTALGLLGQTIALEPLLAVDAIEVARLRPTTRHAGLSLADRVCLALAHRLASPVLTGDRAWADLTLEVEVRQIRDGVG